MITKVIRILVFNRLQFYSKHLFIKMNREDRKIHIADLTISIGHYDL